MRNHHFSQQSVIEYYDKTLFLFLKGWSKEHMHVGYWDKNTKTLEEALLNTSKFIAESLEIEEGDIVLDAGCGIGGSSKYIVSKFGVKTIGINISKAQLKKARELAQTIKNNSLLTFYNQDFTQTTFPDEYFTKIFALESVCHTPNKKRFLKEAYRLLKKRGKIAIADGFQVRSNLTDEEKRMYLNGLNAWAVANFDSKKGFFEKLSQIGFRNVIYHDKKSAIARTSWRMYRKAKKIYPITYLLTKLLMVPKVWHNNTLGLFYQKKSFDRNIITYGVFTAEK